MKNQLRNDLEETYYMVQAYVYHHWQTLYGPFAELDQAIAQAQHAPIGYIIRVAKIHKTTAWMEDYDDEP